MIRPLAALALVLLGSSTCEEGSNRQEPLRILMLVGGEFHRFELMTDLLTRSLQQEMDVVVDRIRIDAPPPGSPRVEKATLPAHPEWLADPDRLAAYDVIVAYHQQKYIDLRPEELEGLLRHIENGGAWVGLHSASDSFVNEPDYVAMVGGRFVAHPPFQTITVQRIEGEHPILDGIETFEVDDEFYELADCSLGDKHVLLVGQHPVDGSTRPVAWTRRHGKGHVFYTILGHEVQTFANEHFRKLVAQAIRWTAAQSRAVAAASER